MQAIRVSIVIAALGALASGSCRPGPTPETLLAQAEALRLRYEKDASHLAISKYHQVLAAWRSQSPRDAARAAQGVGATLQQLGALRESLEAYREALQLAERSTDPLLESEARSDLGFAMALAGDRAEMLDDAERHCREAMAVARDRRALREEAKALVCQGEVIYSRGGNLAAAIGVQQQAEAIWRRLHDRRGMAQAQLSMGWLYSDLRRFDEAQAAFDGAQALWQALSDKRGLAITLVADARLLERRGEYQESLKVFDRAQALLEPMGDALWEGACLTGKGLVYQYLADVARALDYRERGLHAFETSGLKIFAVDVLMSLGLAYLESGDDGAALARFERALGLAREMDNLRWQAWALRNIGIVHLHRQQPDVARQYLEQSLSILPGLDDRRLEAQVLAGLGEAFNLRDESERAFANFEQSVAVSRAAGDRTAVTRGLRALASIEARNGRLESARTHLTAALSAQQKLFGDGHPLVAESRAALADVEFAAGQTDRALSAALQAETISLGHLRFTVRYLPERQALAFASKRPRGLDLALSAVRGASQDVSRVYDLVIQSRGVILDELAARNRLGGPNDPTVDDLQTRTNRARQRFANLLVRSLEGAVPQDQLDEARQEKDEAERVLASQSVEARAEMARSPADLDAVQESLPDGSVLVSIVQYARHAQPTSTLSAAPPPVSSLAAFIVRTGTPGVVLVRLGAAGTIERLIADWRVEAGGRTLRAGGTVEQAERAYRDVGSRLRRVIWDPLASYLGGATRVLVVPDGAVALVPLAALPVGSDSFVLEHAPPIHYLSAERDVVSPSVGPLPGGGMLAVGGPAFDEVPPPAVAPTATGSATETAVLRSSVGACGGFQSLRFQPLDGTLQEAQEVSGLWPAPLGAARALVGREASEQAFKEQARNYRVLHLATHGFFLDGSCLPESGGAGTRGVGGLSGSRPVENPLRLSGLALAGANRRALAGPDEEDGILTAEEVASLDLHGVEWAVLSACDTGVGEIKAGEGVFGLRRAFQVAGARTVVMSLWSVDDQATRAWMRALYEGRFKTGLSTADAVHQASLNVLRDRRGKGLSTHPFYWAAFVAAGDWR
ncbi:MAG: CHAT domain-containing protein [Vicinamibacterales bacterium]